MEKTLRVLSGEESSGHSHSHAHDGRPVQRLDSDVSGVSTSVAMTPNGLRSRGPEKSNGVNHSTGEEHSIAAASPSMLSAYLNLFGDFVHNMSGSCVPFLPSSDFNSFHFVVPTVLRTYMTYFPAGVSNGNVTFFFSMAASFYSSPLIGATTTLACFAHEIPHEIADYSILVRSGFTKKQAMRSQFLTAVGAFVRSFPSPPFYPLTVTLIFNGVFVWTHFFLGHDVDAVIFVRLGTHVRPNQQHEKS